MDRLILEAGVLKRIHVNKHVIASNRKHGTQEPVYTTKCKGKTYISESVHIEGPSKAIYTPEKPLSCGAVAYITTVGAVCLINVKVKEKVCSL